MASLQHRTRLRRRMLTHPTPHPPPYGGTFPQGGRLGLCAGVSFLQKPRTPPPDRRRRMQNPRKRRSRRIWDVFRFRAAKSSVFSRRRKTPREPPGSQVYSRAPFSWIEWRKTICIWRKAPVTGAFPLIFEFVQAAKPNSNSLFAIRSAPHPPVTRPPSCGRRRIHHHYPPAHPAAAACA